MPAFFVCTTGPMGGANIVFVCGTLAEARQWARRNAAQYGRELFIYQLIA